MKVTIESRNPTAYTLATMPVGSIATRRRDGNIFLRILESAINLSDPIASYSGNANMKNKPEDEVDLLPPSTRVALEVTP